MLKSLKATFAKDRWKVIRVVHFKNGGSAASWTQIMVRNKYNGKIRTYDLDGHWEWNDFPDQTYAG